MQPRLLVCYLVIGFSLASFLHAQELQWQNLAQIKAGTRVQVVEQSLKSVSGRLVRVSETDLTLKLDNKEVVVPRNQVYRVSISGKNRKRNVLLGLAAGAAAGAAVGAASTRVVGNAVVPAAMLSFAGVGAGIGAVVPASETVYRAELPKDASLKEKSPRE